MPLDADVKVTKALTPDVQAVADAREKVRELDAKVESAKLALKLVRDERETAFEDLTAAIDEMVNAERQPSLFPPGADAPEPPPGPDQPGPDAPAGGGEGEIVDAEYTVSTALVPAGEFGRAQAIAAGRRGMSVTEALEAHSRVFDAFDAHGVETMGQLADRLKAGETFGLRLTDVEDLKEEVEQVSSADAEPVSFADELPKEADADDGQGEDEPSEAAKSLFGGAAAWRATPIVSLDVPSDVVTKLNKQRLGIAGLVADRLELGEDLGLTPKQRKALDAALAKVRPAKAVDVLNLPKPKRTRKAKAKKAKS